MHMRQPKNSRPIQLLDQQFELLSILISQQLCLLRTLLVKKCSLFSRRVKLMMYEIDYGEILLVSVQYEHHGPNYMLTYSRPPLFDGAPIDIPQRRVASTRGVKLQLASSFIMYIMSDSRKDQKVLLVVMAHALIDYYKALVSLITQGRVLLGLRTREC